MEKPTSPFSNENTTSATSSTTVDGQNYVSPQTSLHQYYPQDVATDLSSMHNSISPSEYSPLPHSLSLTPSSCSSSDDHLHQNLKLTSEAMATEHRLNQARFILEFQQLCDHYDLCFARLQALIREIETLRRENTDLRLANTELIKLQLSLSSSQAAMMNRNLLQREEVWERKNGNAQRNSMPKNVSVRSSSYRKVKQQQQQGSSNNQQRLLNPSLGEYMACEARREEKARDLEVYNQGMVKTELCNKWEETGTCPYGELCQFAHGIMELRPVMRHPRYKTQVCRMVLSGHTCPYNHRCHFRHSLTDQERRLLIPR